ncbi:Flagellum-specific ATP synthase [Thalassovita gelatinovora]|uniref:Flagellum-specific ATP synthase n=1 Tax=Thalassovita gelatinovora TaxID=53501 RepID=A0A0N7LW97_THAGE|nr:FliI/YscN family ATPase [Thalassovita gelatinovora]QIZ82407.1 FliI/YscN family ATPase [Thalassovita gelatinovora]CUH68490.1 Flagellum-specific ATP synthase [Thalassovita gelatinovora]SEQ53396.1 flagellum-specific ATP synthase [Thalassovita gelatinovora]
MTALLDRLEHDLATLADRCAPQISGQVLRYDGLVVESSGFPASPGDLCQIFPRHAAAGTEPIEAEVIGFSNGKNLLFLDTAGAQITLGDPIVLRRSGRVCEVGPELLGRVIDASGAPLDGRPAPRPSDRWPLGGKPLNPLARTPVREVLDVGVRILNSAMTIGRGQRVGIMAGSGVGKSVLIEMMTHNTTADVIVVGLIGERAREVGDFVSRVMTGEAAQRICVVAVPADRSPLLRLRAANRTTAIAEYFRDQGKDVLMIMDSLTRVAHAKREAGLALGEQPTAKGYTPSVISLIPALIERCGPGLPGQGTITALYTVLADGDDTTNDPVVDSARAILDGHMVLSRSQAQRGIYPAIDLPASISRVMNDIVSPEHVVASQKLRRMISLYMDNRDLMLMGGYSAGQDKDLDKAIALWPQIEAFICQLKSEKVTFEESATQLIKLVGGSNEQA